MVTDNMKEREAKIRGRRGGKNKYRQVTRPVKQALPSNVTYFASFLF